MQVDRVTTPAAERTVEWQGSWITSGEDAAPAPLLRREFAAPDGVTGARVHVAGLGVHRTTFNGAPATDARLESGLTAYDHTVLFSSYDLAVQPGANVIGIELGRGFYAMTTPNVWRWEQPVWRSLRKALVQIELTSADGSTETIVSDQQWHWSSGPTTSDSYYEGETYDARLDPTGWDAPGFDASLWSPVLIADAPAGQLAPQQHEPVRVVASVDVVEWFGGADGRPLVADFGTTLAGWTKISTAETSQSGLPVGTMISLIFGEQLEEDGSVHNDNKLVYSERFDTDQVITGDGALEWEPRFSYKGFRYVQVEGITDPAAITLTAKHAHNDVTEVSRFTCSDEVLTWIDSAMRLTVRNNLHHVPTDTPVYEKNGWTGDAQVAAETMLGQYDLRRLLTKWLGDMADSQNDQGLIPVVIPSAGWGYDELAPAPEWTTLYPFLLDRLVFWYDDPDLARRHLDPVVRYLDYELGRIDADGLTSGVLGDYLAPGMHGTPSSDDLRIAASCYLHRALRLTADLIDQVGHDADSGRLRTAASSLAGALNTTFLDTEAGVYRSDREPDYRQTSNILPVAMGITPDEHVQAVVDHLVADLHAHDDHHNAGCLGLSQLFRVLTAHGYADLAITVATQTTPPSWGAWMAAGESTMREMWNPESRSHNHYFMGTLAQWLYDSVAGVRILAPGWTEFEVNPLARAGLSHASYVYDSPRGPLGASWREVDGAFSVTVTVPSGTRARVHLPSQEPFWAEEGEWTYPEPA